MDQSLEAKTRYLVMVGFQDRSAMDSLLEYGIGLMNKVGSYGGVVVTGRNDTLNINPANGVVNETTYMSARLMAADCNVYKNMVEAYTLFGNIGNVLREFRGENVELTFLVYNSQSAKAKNFLEVFARMRPEYPRALYVTAEKPSIGIRYRSYTKFMEKLYQRVLKSRVGFWFAEKFLCSTGPFIRYAVDIKNWIVLR